MQTIKVAVLILQTLLAVAGRQVDTIKNDYIQDFSDQYNQEYSTGYQNNGIRQSYPNNGIRQSYPNNGIRQSYQNNDIRQPSVYQDSYYTPEHSDVNDYANPVARNLPYQVNNDIIIRGSANSKANPSQVPTFRLRNHPFRLRNQQALTAIRTNGESNGEIESPGLQDASAILSNASESKVPIPEMPNNEIVELQDEIKDTTKQIQSLYTSLEQQETGSGRSDVEEKAFKNQTKEELFKKLEESNRSVKTLGDRLKMEREVRREMIRILARVKLDDALKTRALRAAIHYLPPNQGLIQNAKIPNSLKRVIINERIRMLSHPKRLEFQKRLEVKKRLDLEKRLISTKGPARLIVPR